MSPEPFDRPSDEAVPPPRLMHRPSAHISAHGASDTNSEAMPTAFSQSHPQARLAISVAAAAAPQTQRRDSRPASALIGSP